MGDRKIELPEGIPPLTTYYFYLTGGCNLACKHCWIAPTYQAHGGTGGHLDFELFKSAIEQGIPLGLGIVKLTGGEPLLHPDFYKIIDFLYEKDIILIIETNGVLVSPETARYLKDKSTLRHISVSLDGSKPETHDPFRGVKGSFEKACDGIRNLVAVGYRPQVIMSLHAGNVEEIEALTLLAEELGAGSVKFNLIEWSGRGDSLKNQEQLLDVKKLIELGHWMDEDLSKRTSIQLHYSWPKAFFTLKKLMSTAGYSCNIFNVLGVLSTGHMAMCGIGVQVPDLCYGKLGQDRVLDVWTHNPIITQLRRNVPENLEGICGKCMLRGGCLGTCVADNYFSSGSLSSPYWFCQTAYENGLFPSTRISSD